MLVLPLFWCTKACTSVLAVKENQTQVRPAGQISTADVKSIFLPHSLPQSYYPKQVDRRGPVNRRNDMPDAVGAEVVVLKYLRDLHGPKVSPVSDEEQKVHKMGDVRMPWHEASLDVEVKMERKGAVTGRHALEISEYIVDGAGNPLKKHVPGWFSATKANIVVAVVPVDDRTLALFPYSVRVMRDYMRELTLEHGAMGLEAVIPGLKITYGPVNHMEDGRMKRSMSVCIPYQHLMSAGVMHRSRLDFTNL